MLEGSLEHAAQIKKHFFPGENPDKVRLCVCARTHMRVCPLNNTKDPDVPNTSRGQSWAGLKSWNQEVEVCQNQNSFTSVIVESDFEGFIHCFFWVIPFLAFIVTNCIFLREDREEVPLPQCNGWHFSSF